MAAAGYVSDLVYKMTPVSAAGTPDGYASQLIYKVLSVDSDGNPAGASEDNLTANAGGGQASALALSAAAVYHRITVCATAADSVALPAATVGQAHYVRNDGAAAAQVFGTTPDTINSIATGTGVSLPAGQGALFFCTTAAKWTTSVGVGPFSGTTITASGNVTLANNTALQIRQASGTARTVATVDASDNLLIGSVAYTSAKFLGSFWQNTDAGADLGGTSNRWRDCFISRDYYLSGAIKQSAGGNSTNLNAVNTASKIVKAIASIADNVATDTITVTVPNAAHSASLKLTLKGSLGAGGAIGANEGTAVISYDVAIARTAGVATVAVVSTAYGSATASVAGAATVAITAAASAMTGAVGATQTFTIQVTIARGSGSSTNHTCQVVAEIINANATGVTIA